MALDSDFTERVRQTVNIVDLVGGYVHLRKKGQNYWALCPFHQERTPSFSVNEERQIFKCFGCGSGGDSFAFVQRIENMSFPESIRFLAERYGIPLPTASYGENQQRERLLEIMGAADSFYRDQLRREPAARDYIANRGITEETVRRFGLGYAPPGNRTMSELLSKGYAQSELEECGLCARSADRSAYDKFRNRVMFPIQNLAGQTIAFGGRIIGEGQPKYLNSPETPLYSKGNNLYGLGAARDAIRKKGFAILVEGYFDCIVPSQLGVQNVVASLGTSLTQGQVRLLGRYTRQVIVNFDPDSAGVSAALRSLDSLLENGFRINVVGLPDGSDPDGFIRTHGVEAYHEILRTSLPFFDFLLTHQIGMQKDPGSPKGKREIAESLLPYLLRIPNRIERAEYLSRISSRLQIEESILRAELRRFARPAREQLRKPETAPADILEPTLAEKTLLAASLDEKRRDGVLQRIDAELIEGLVSEKIFILLMELQNQVDPKSVFAFRERLSEEDLDLLDRISIRSGELLLSDEAVERSVEALRDLQLNRVSRQIQEEIGREEKTDRVSPRLDELLRLKESLRKRHQT